MLHAVNPAANIRGLSALSAKNPTGTKAIAYRICMQELAQSSVMNLLRGTCQHSPFLKSSPDAIRLIDSVDIKHTNIRIGCITSYCGAMPSCSVTMRLSWLFDVFLTRSKLWHRVKWFKASLQLCWHSSLHSDLWQHPTYYWPSFQPTWVSIWPRVCLRYRLLRNRANIQKTGKMHGFTQNVNYYRVSSSKGWALCIGKL